MNLGEKSKFLGVVLDCMNVQRINPLAQNIQMDHDDYDLCFGAWISPSLSLRVVGGER